jgi:hypothetical protein
MMVLPRQGFANLSQNSFGEVETLVQLLQLGVWLASAACASVRQLA